MPANASSSAIIGGIIGVGGASLYVVSLATHSPVSKPLGHCSASASDVARNAAGGAAGLTRQLVQHARRLGSSVLHHDASISFHAIARNPSLARQARAELDHHHRSSDGAGPPSLPIPVVSFAHRLHS